VISTAMGEKRTKASGSPVQASVRHQRPTNRLRAGENDDEVEATNKTLGLGEALDVEVASHRYERAKGEKEHELEQRFQRVCINDQRAQNGKSRKRAQVRRRGIVEGEEVAGTNCETTRQGQGCRTSLVMSVKKTKRTRETNLNSRSTIKAPVCAISPTNT
jgi:hypothetical protein